MYPDHSLATLGLCILFHTDFHTYDKRDGKQSSASENEDFCFTVFFFFTDGSLRELLATAADPGFSNGNVIFQVDSVTLCKQS